MARRPTACSFLKVAYSIYTPARMPLKWTPVRAKQYNFKLPAKLVLLKGGKFRLLTTFLLCRPFGFDP